MVKIRKKCGTCYLYLYARESVKQFWKDLSAVEKKINEAG